MVCKFKNAGFLFRNGCRTFCPGKKSQILENQECDLIGPPNPVTNLRPIKFAKRENETELEKLLRLKREEVQLWNEEFWSNHNEKFFQEKKEYISNQMKKMNETKSELTADELSVFYKDFLDKNWRNHFNYNINWYKKNLYITALDFQVRLQRIFNKFR